MEFCRQYRLVNSTKGRIATDDTGSKIPGDVVAELLVEGRADGERTDVAPQERIAVGCGFGDRFAADRPPAPPRLSTRICWPRAAPDHDWATKTRGRVHRIRPRGEGHHDPGSASPDTAQRRRVPKTRETRKESFVSCRPIRRWPRSSPANITCPGAVTHGATTAVVPPEAAAQAPRGAHDEEQTASRSSRCGRGSGRALPASTPAAGNQLYCRLISANV